MPNRTTSPKRQRVLIKHIIDKLRPRFAPDATVICIGDTGNKKFLHFDQAYLESLGVVIAPSASMPDLIMHDNTQNWLLLVEAVTSDGPIDGKRRSELKRLFKDCKAGLVFVTAFESSRTMLTFFPRISWGTEIWIAEHPNHLIHLDGRRLLGPHPDVLPSRRHETP
jgi:adenine-specific DNA-methyltransferase